MTRTHGQRFAKQALPETVFDNPLAFARRLANQQQALQLLGSIWESAGATLPAVDRLGKQGLGAHVEQRGAFCVIHVAVPPPRGIGDPCAIVILGRGDGATKLDTVAYYILELDIDHASRTHRFVIATRGPHDDESHYVGEGPAPDPKWLADHVCALWANRKPEPPTGTPAVPAWYWWYMFRGAEVLSAWATTSASDQSQLQLLHREPILLMPEIAECAELFVGAHASSLRKFQRQLRYEQAFGGACRAAASQLANAHVGIPAANLTRALKLLDDAREYGNELSKLYAVEALIRAKLAAIGIDARKNYEEAGRLDALARGEQPPARDEQPRRLARGTEIPATNDPTWRSLFLDTPELPFFTRTDDRRDEAPNDAAFAACGGLHAGFVGWTGQDGWPMWRVIDTRWLFATPAAADQYLRTVLPLLGDGLPQLPAPQLGDVTYAFGARGAGQILVFRVGRMVGKLAVAEGPNTVLDQAMIMPLAQRAAQRAQWTLSRYWLGVGRGVDAATLFAQSPSARLLAEYPILALPELPAAMATLGDQFTPAAHALWNLQSQLRSQQWQAHREATAALVRTLLDDRESDPRVNAAHAYALVTEIRALDPDPVWVQLEAECCSRR